MVNNLGLCIVGTFFYHFLMIWVVDYPFLHNNLYSTGQPSSYTSHFNDVVDYTYQVGVDLIFLS